MKLVNRLVFSAMLLFCYKGVNAVNPAITFTLINPCTPQVTINPLPNTQGCYSITAFNGNVNDPDAYYQWNFDDGTTAIGKTVYHCYSPAYASINHTLSLTYNSPALCGVFPNVFTYTITTIPSPIGICVNNTPSITLAASSVTVWAGVAIPEIITSYNYGDGSSIQPSYTHTYSACGNYIIEVKTWDMNSPANICYAYAAVNIACNAATVNPTGISKNFKEKGLVLFPNPSKELISIKTANPIKNLIVFDVLGKEMDVVFELENVEGKLYISGLLYGTYFVKVQFENNTTAITKFIKQ
jgi:hypothetical protein